MKKEAVLICTVFSIFFMLTVPSLAFAKLGWVFVTQNGGSFVSVSMVSSTEGWAAGSAGLYYYNGINWELKEPIGSIVSCVKMVSSSDGWAGGSGFWRWNGLHWNQVQPVGTNLTGFKIVSIAMLNPSFGWAVGYRTASNDGYVFHWNGFAWEFLGAIYPGGLLYDVCIVDESNAWTVGWYGKVLKWNGTSWNEIFSPTSATLHSVHMISANDGWIVGYELYTTSGGRSLHWDGSQLTSVAVPSESNGLYSVFMVGSNNVWAAGPYGSAKLIHWDGASWAVDVSAPFDLYDINFLNPSDGWVAGKSGFGHWTQVDETPPQISNIVQNPLPYNVGDGQTVQVNVTVTDASGVKTVTLCCIRSDSSVWSNTSMSEIASDLYSGTIPGCPKGTTVTYVIVAQDNVGNSIPSTALGYTLTYTVIPEFASISLVLIFMVVVSFVGILWRKHATT